MNHLLNFGRDIFNYYAETPLIEDNPAEVKKPSESESASESESTNEDKLFDIQNTPKKPSNSVINFYKSLTSKISILNHYEINLCEAQIVSTDVITNFSRAMYVRTPHNIDDNSLTELIQCYDNIFKKAAEHNVTSIDIPSFSITIDKGFDPEEASNIAISRAKHFFELNPKSKLIINFIIHPSDIKSTNAYKKINTQSTQIKIYFQDILEHESDTIIIPVGEKYSPGRLTNLIDGLYRKNIELYRISKMTLLNQSPNILLNNIFCPPVKIIDFEQLLLKNFMNAPTSFQINALKRTCKFLFNFFANPETVFTNQPDLIRVKSIHNDFLSIVRHRKIQENPIVNNNFLRLTDKASFLNNKEIELCEAKMVPTNNFINYSQAMYVHVPFTYHEDPIIKLNNCYDNIFRKAAEYNVTSIDIPSFSTGGEHGFDARDAAWIAISKAKYYVLSDSKLVVNFIIHPNDIDNFNAYISRHDTMHADYKQKIKIYQQDVTGRQGHTIVLPVGEKYNPGRLAQVIDDLYRTNRISFLNESLNISNVAPSILNVRPDILFEKIFQAKNNEIKILDNKQTSALKRTCKFLLSFFENPENVFGIYQNGLALGVRHINNHFLFEVEQRKMELEQRKIQTKIFAQNPNALDVNRIKTFKPSDALTHLYNHVWKDENSTFEALELQRKKIGREIGLFTEDGAYNNSVAHILFGDNFYDLCKEGAYDNLKDNAQSFRVFHNSLINNDCIVDFLKKTVVITTEGDNRLILPNGEKSIVQLDKFLTDKERRLKRASMVTAGKITVTAIGGFRSTRNSQEKCEVIFVNSAAPQFEKYGMNFGELEVSDFIVKKDAARNFEPLFNKYYSDGFIPGHVELETIQENINKTLEDAKDQGINLSLDKLRQEHPVLVLDESSPNALEADVVKLRNGDFLLLNSSKKAMEDYIGSLILPATYEIVGNDSRPIFLKATAFGAGFFSELGYGVNAQKIQLTKYVFNILVKNYETLIKQGKFKKGAVIEFPFYDLSLLTENLKQVAKDAGIELVWKGNTRDLLDFAPVESVSGTILNPKDYNIVILNAGDTFAFTGNEPESNSLEAMIANNSNLRLVANFHFNPNLLDPKNHIKV